ncbi:unnamed protein product [Mytilus edulis]|uniref:Uncharacterized protein n=1 Tax=Mytilus edulis TaxID=6550 RepID=A0A8S3PRU7_MYTED|nr:unnamed protein product [Mytilus edulis]
MGHRQNIIGDNKSVHIGMVHRQNITRTKYHIGMGHDKIEGRTHWYGSQTKYHKDAPSVPRVHDSQRRLGVHIGMVHGQNITRDDSSVRTKTKLVWRHRQNITSTSPRAYTLGRQERTHWYGSQTKYHRTKRTHWYGSETKHITRDDFERTHWYGSQTKYHKERLERLHWYTDKISQGTTRAYTLGFTDKISQGTTTNIGWVIVHKGRRRTNGSQTKYHKGRLERWYGSYTHWYGSQTKYHQRTGIGHRQISQGTTRAYTLVWVTDKISQTTRAYTLVRQNIIRDDSSVYIGMGHRQNITRDDSSVHIGIVYRQNITRDDSVRTHWYGSQTKYHKGRLERTLVWVTDKTSRDDLHWYETKSQIHKGTTLVVRTH